MSLKFKSFFVGNLTLVSRGNGFSCHKFSSTKNGDLNNSIKKSFNPKNSIKTLEDQRFGYDERCRSLINSQKSKFLTPSSLAHMPFNCMKFNDDENFVNKVSLNWFSVLVREKNRVPLHNWPVTFYGLAQVNKTTKGKLLTILTGERLLVLANVVIRGSVEIEPKKFAMFLKSLRNLLTDQPGAIKKDVAEKLSSLTPEYINACEQGWLHYPNDVPSAIGSILFEFAMLGVTRPMEPLTVKDTCYLCWLALDTDPRKYGTNLWYLCYLDQIVTVFLMWSIDPNKHSAENFWRKYFKMVQDFYPITGDDSFFAAIILRNATLATLRFDQWEEFLKYKLFWIQNFTRHVLSFRNNDSAWQFSGEIKKKLNDKVVNADVRNFLTELLEILFEE